MDCYSAKSEVVIRTVQTIKGNEPDTEAHAFIGPFLWNIQDGGSTEAEKKRLGFRDHVVGTVGTDDLMAPGLSSGVMKMFGN